MANFTSAPEDYLPLTEEKYGPYLNQSLEYYGRNPDFANMSDFQKGKYITEFCKNQTETLTFDTDQLVRVIVTWILFFISAVGNIFVLLCVCRRSRTSHVHMIMLHFAIADLAFTFLVLPEDALWNTTMQWYGGDILCRACQMGKQLGMYISSFMVVVMAVDRCCGILQPMCTISKQRRRTKYLVGGAWILSVISAIPPAILFSIANAPFCPDMEPFVQCVDGNVVAQEKLKPYYFFTMVMSFLLPMILCTVCYSLVIYEITNMMKKDRVMMGRRDSSVGITRARKKTLKMTALVTLTFLLFWGPYYAYGIYFWFTGGKFSQQISITLFTLMYVNPAVHPFIYGVLMKDVRSTFRTMMLHLEKIITCSTSDIDEIRRRRLNSRYSVDNSATTTTCLRASDFQPGARTDWGRRSSSDTSSPQNPELSLLRQNEDSIPLCCGDGSCLQSSENTHCSRGNGYVLSVNDGPPSNGVPDENADSYSMTDRRNHGERDRLISANSDHVSEDAFPPLQTLSPDTAYARGSTRTSTVTFKLPPPDETRENGGTGINNNQEVVDRKNGDFLKSTDV